MDLERDLMTRYLLGVVTDAEDAEIGVRLIDNPSFAEKVSQAEYDLIEDYIEGGLSASEREMFEQEYLISDERIERVREIVLLKKFAARSATTVAEVGSEESTVPWYRRLKILVPAFALLILAVIFGLLLVDRERVGGLDYAHINRQDLRDPAIIGNAQIVQLDSGTYRSGTPGSATVVNRRTSAIVFRLPLTFSVAENTVYDASIEQDGRKLFSVKPVNLYTVDGGLEARMLAPLEVFSAGMYNVRIVRRDSDDAFVLYTFEVR